ncbi:hypothetical protein B0H13DRAFT_1857609 [Mycena leptocephala]|nr:hypothetical protein B0H13DRAFT_1857609 [Mycena leptocephala]
MSSLPEFETCLSILPLAPLAPGGTITNTTFLFILIVLVAAGIIHHASPLCLTRVLVTAIANLAKIYLEALETGLLSASDSDTAEMLSSLQLKVSKIRESSLRNALSHSGALRDFFEGHIEGISTPRRQITPLRKLSHSLVPDNLTVRFSETVREFTQEASDHSRSNTNLFDNPPKKKRKKKLCEKNHNAVSYTPEGSVDNIWPAA